MMRIREGIMSPSGSLKSKGAVTIGLGGLALLLIIGGLVLYSSSNQPISAMEVGVPSQEPIADSPSVSQEEATYSVSGLIFDDKNNDGLKSSGEEFLSGWAVTLKQNDIVISTQTDTEGRYEFTGVSQGSYIICALKQSAWTQTFPVSGETCEDGKGYSITVSGSVDSLNFGYKSSTGTSAASSVSSSSSGPSEGGGGSSSSAAVAPAQDPPAQVVTYSISGIKYHDDDEDGVKDASEQGLAGWTIKLTQADNTMSVVTDSNGAYSFSGLAPGIYTVCEQLTSGWEQTAPSSGPSCTDGTKGHIVTITNSSVSGKDFGNDQFGGNSIAGIKFKDIDADGIKDENEPVLFGWTIFLDEDGNGILDSGEESTATDGNGSFSFDDLNDGTFLVREVEQPTWTRTTPNPGPIKLTGDQQATGILFGNCPFECTIIGGFKFNDLDEDGVWDSNEPSLEGWTIFLDGNENGQIDSGELNKVTNSNGEYRFSGLPAGTYAVREVLQADWFQTTQNPAPITLQVDEKIENVNFGNNQIFRNNAISGMKFKDLDSDSVKDADEVGLQGWTIQLLQNGEVLTTTMTDASGMYEFTGLTDGSYTVCESLQSGWTQTFPKTGMTCSDGTKGYSITVKDGATSVSNDFGNIARGTIVVIKKSINGTGTFNFTGSLGSFQITTKATSGSEPNVFVGSRTFLDVSAGTHSVVELTHAEFNLVDVICSDGSSSDQIQLDAGETIICVFVNEKKEKGKISGIKFEDINHNGKQDAPIEQKLADWTIFLDQDGDNMLDSGERSTVTDINGAYMFDQLSPGTYSVREVMKDGWIRITPNPGPITIVGGEHVMNINFGNQNVSATNTIRGMKFNDRGADGVKDAGEEGLEGWIIFLDEDGDNQFDMSSEMSDVTDSAGKYEFTNLLPGTYVVREVQQEGWTQTTQNPGPIEVSSATVVEDIDFGNNRVLPTNAISGMKFNDTDGDGTKDSDEAALAGWTIQLLQDDEVLATTVTDADGNYEFTGLTDGNYTVCEMLQTGWEQTFPNEGPDCPDGTFGHSVSVEGGESSINNNFGNAREAKIIIIKKSINGTGTFNFSGSLGSFQITTSGSGVAIGSKTFAHLTPETYSVSEIPQDGFTLISTTCTDGSSVSSISLSAGETVTCVFVNEKKVRGKISGMKFEDINHNFVRDDPFEKGLSGWTIFLDMDGDNVLDSGERSTVTDANGNYMFDDLEPGTYIVREVQQEGWIQMTPNPGPITITDGENVKDVNFGNQNIAATNTIKGMKFSDLDADSVKDSGEPGLQGWTIFLDEDGNNQLDAGEMSTVTDASGAYEFTNLLPGTYFVREVQQPTWTQTTANPGPLTVDSGDVFENVNFGNHKVLPTNTISGVKFNDTNGDGTQDIGEAGLPGWTIKLMVDGEVLATTVTDESGSYEFTGLVDDTYTLCEVLQSGWEQTFPDAGPSCSDGTKGYEISVEDGESSINNNFGNAKKGKIIVIKKSINGTGNFSFTGSLGSFQIKPTADGSGVFMGSKVFDDVSIGTHSVSEAVPSDFDLVSTACSDGSSISSISVSAGETVTCVFVNQKKARGQISGYKWEDINHNQMQDSGEPRVEGWTIFFDDDNDGTLDAGERSTITNTNGDFVFDKLAPGTYRVREVQRQGWIQMTLNPGPITITDDEHITGINFGNQNVSATIFIRGFVFQDTDQDGIKDAGEPALSGWTVFMDEDGDHVFDAGELSEVTGANGAYEFANLLPGTYFVREVEQPGWMQTSPNPDPITVEPGDQANSVNFGNVISG